MKLQVHHHGHLVTSDPVLDALTPHVLSTVFGVTATTQRDPDGIIRITYAPQPLAKAS